MSDILKEYLYQIRGKFMGWQLRDRITSTCCSLFIRTTQEREQGKVLGINRMRTKSTDLQDIRTTQLSSHYISSRNGREKFVETV